MSYRYLHMFCLLFSLPAAGQRCGVLVDMETRQPVAGATVYTNTGKKVQTDWRGRFCLPEVCSSVTFTHENYLRRNMDIRNMRDTTFLLPREVTVNTVVITAPAPKPHFDMNFSGQMQQDRLTAPSKPSGMNFLGIFENKPLSGKLRKKIRDAIRNY